MSQNLFEYKIAVGLDAANQLAKQGFRVVAVSEGNYTMERETKAKAHAG